MLFNLVYLFRKSRPLRNPVNHSSLRLLCYQLPTSRPARSRTRVDSPVGMIHAIGLYPALHRFHLPARTREARWLFPQKGFHRCLARLTMTNDDLRPRLPPPPRAASTIVVCPATSVVRRPARTAGCPRRIPGGGHRAAGTASAASSLRSLTSRCRRLSRS
jgi:hypothetical protein